MKTAHLTPSRPSVAASRLKALFSACCAVLATATFTPQAHAQVVAPQYAGTYTLVNLGQAADVPANYGGLTFKAGDPNTLLIGGGANNSTAAIYEVTATRGPGGHITGFTGPATLVSTAAGTSFGGIDGGLTYGPGGTLFYTSYSSNEIGQILPGSSTPDYLFPLNGLTASSVGSIVFVPPGFPGAGQAKILSYTANRWYTLDLAPHTEIPGTFNFSNPTNEIDIGSAGGPEGAVYISSANALFPNPSVLIAGYGANKVVAYDVDLNGDPIPETVRDFITGLSGAEGATIDPVTGDFLFSTFGSGSQVIAIRGFVPPPAPTDPIFTELHTKGGAVPGAGVDTRIQVNSVWNGFGTPAVSDEGHVAFLGKWKAPAIKVPKTPAQSGAGIFVNNALLVKVGDPVPGISDAVFKSFKDPVIASNGRVAFIAGIKGATTATIIPPLADTVVVTNGRDGSLEVLAREGDAAPDSGDATFKAFSSVSIQAGPSIVASALVAPGSDSGIVFTGTLNPGTGTPAATTASDMGAWWLPAERSVLKKAIREGDPGFFVSDNVKSFVLLKALGGSPGFGRGNVNGETLLALATSATNVQGLVRFSQDSSTVALLSGSSLGSLDVPAATWAKLGMPSMDETGNNIAMLGQLKTGPTGVPSANAKGVFKSLSAGEFWEPVARSGETAPGFGTGVFTAFKDPLISPTCSDIAFLGTAKPTPTARALTGIWFKPDLGSLALIASQGAQPPGAPPLAQWKSFASVALPGGETGPLFTAFLVKGVGAAPGPGGITSIDDFALYFTNYHGAVRELIRENQPLLGKTVKAFSVLKAASGSAGSTRAYNDQREVILQVTFTDKSVSIVHILLPETPVLPPG